VVLSISTLSTILPLPKFITSIAAITAATRHIDEANASFVPIFFTETTPFRFLIPVY
jgi:hypothetical protein